MSTGPEWIRAINRQRVLHLIRADGPISRAEAAQSTGLTRPTISAVVADLMAEGWVEEIGTAESSGGRRPMLIRFNPGARWVVGAELGAGHVRAILTDLNGRVIGRVKRRVETSDPLGEVEKLIGAIAELRAPYLGSSNAPPIAGVGVGLTGMVDPHAGKWRFSPHFQLDDLPIADLLRSRLGLPVLVQNDARAMAWGERAFGVARGVENLVYIRIGVGVGAGIVFDGRLYSGAQHGAGEIGHMVVDDNGPRCRCGSYGCVEALAGAAAIARRAIKRLQQGAVSTLTERSGGDLNSIIGSTVIEAALDGDDIARDTLREAGRSVGVAVANLINLLNPTMVVIGGGTSRAGEHLLTPLQESASARVLAGIRGRTQIVQTALGEDSCPLGGAALVIEQLLRSSPAG